MSLDLIKEPGGVGRGFKSDLSLLAYLGLSGEAPDEERRGQFEAGLGFTLSDALA